MDGHVCIRAADGVVSVPGDVFDSFLALSQFDARPEGEVPAPNVSRAAVQQLLHARADEDSINFMSMNELITMQCAADFLNASWALTLCCAAIAKRINQTEIPDVHMLLGVPPPQPRQWHFD